VFARGVVQALRGRQAPHQGEVIFRQFIHITSERPCKAVRDTYPLVPGDKDWHGLK
jgi:hypothetical protein